MESRTAIWQINNIYLLFITVQSLCPCQDPAWMIWIWWLIVDRLWSDPLKLTYSGFANSSLNLAEHKYKLKINLLFLGQWSLLPYHSLVYSFTDVELLLYVKAHCTMTLISPQLWPHCCTAQQTKVSLIWYCKALWWFYTWILV